VIGVARETGMPKVLRSPEGHIIREVVACRKGGHITPIRWRAPEGGMASEAYVLSQLPITATMATLPA
jgi:hypothetical protein